MKINNEKGVALVFALFFVLTLAAFDGILLLKTAHEAMMSRVEREQARTFYAAHGGAQAAIEQVEVLINTYLLNTISSSSPSGVISYAQSKIGPGDGIGWLVNAVRNNNVPVLAQNGEEASYTVNSTMGETNYTYNIIFTEKSDPSSVGTDAWDFPYSYRIESTGTKGTINSNVVISGDFTVRVQRDNFAKFALFTNNQKMSSGTNVWFTDKTNFFGPVHTNDRFNFAFNPSGTFQETASQYQQTARFYNNNNSVLINADSNGTIDVPQFGGAFNRNAGQVVLNSATNEADMLTQVKGSTDYQNNGIYLPASGSNLTGGIYVKGNSTIALSVNNQKAVYTITQGGTTKTITVDPAANQTIVTANNSSTTYNGLPDGADHVGTLLFVDGSVTSLAGTVQQSTELTIATHSDMVITNNVKYESYTPGSGTPGQSGYVPPTANGSTNLMGLVSWIGNVRIGTAAPNNVEVHGTVMAASGVFSVDNYNDSGVGPRGTATLLGGAITNNYGAFGQFNSSNGQMVSGYGRNFVYDNRMQQGTAPPYFPSLDTFIAFTNDIKDKIVWQEGD